MSVEGNQRHFTDFVGVYDADGGVVGETKYVIGHLFGRAECALCDITHSPVRRKPAWDAMTRRVGVPWRLLHRNELDTEVAAALAGADLPVVMGREASGEWVLLLTREQLRATGGSVTAFEASLTMACRLQG